MARLSDSAPSVDGLRLVQRVDPAETAGRGELWHARRVGGSAVTGARALPADLPGAGTCVVRLLRLPVDPVFRARALVLARDLIELDDPGVVRVLEARPAFDGIALVLDAPPLPVLALDRLGRTRMLAAGELVSVGVAVAWALDAVHARGLTHGDLRDADILVPAGGRPVLSGFGIMGVCGAPGEPRDDVRALARLLASLLDLDSPGAAPLMSALDRARADADDTAAEMAVRVAAATPALPVSLSGAPDADEGVRPEGRPKQSRRPRVRVRERGSGRHRLVDPAAAGPTPGDGQGLTWRRLLPLAPVLVLAAAAIGWVMSDPPDDRGVATEHPVVPAVSAPIPIAEPSPTAAPVDVRWRRILLQLAADRAYALGSPARADLGRVDAVGSPARQADEALLQGLRGRGWAARGLTMEITSAAPAATESAASADPARSGAGPDVTLRVRDRLSAYRLVDAAGVTVERVAARPAQDHLVTVRRTSAGWRLVRVQDVNPTPARSAPPSGPPAAAGDGT